MEKKKAVRGSHLLLATGREPNTDLLQLELANISTDEKGFIPVNEKLETEVLGIFALGDCNGKGAFTHTAFHDFEIIKDHISGAQKKKKPATVFSIMPSTSIHPLHELASPKHKL